MIPSIGRTILAAQSWPTMNLAALARSLSGPFNDDYNQLHSCYQCHGSPIGKVYVNTPWPAVCFDVDNELMYLKQDLRINNKGWQSETVNDPVFDNLTHYWSMDEASGTRQDSKGTINLLEIGGAVSSGIGKDANAADFNTADRWLSTPAAPLVEALTFAFWIKVRTLPAAGKVYRLISESEVNGGALYVMLNDAGSIVFNDTGIGADDPDISMPLGALNTWHLVVATTNPLDTQYLSVDGTAFATGSAVNQGGNMSIILALGPTFTGVGNNQAPTVLDGLMDEVMVFGTTLTQGNVTTLWNGGAGTFYRP